jgi:hypothetical protein
MKHPSYKKASNQYANRANKKLSKESKEAHKEEMRRFNKHLKDLTEE